MNAIEEKTLITVASIGFVTIGAMWLAKRAANGLGDAVGSAIDTAVQGVKDAGSAAADFVNPASPTGGFQTGAQVAQTQTQEFIASATGNPNYAADMAANEKNNGFYNWVNNMLGSWGTKPTSTDPIAQINPANTGGASGSW